MKKVLFLMLTAAVALSYGADKAQVSEQEIKMMEDMGVFDEVARDSKEQPKVPQGRPDQRQGADTKENMEAMILARVKSELELTPEQAGKFVENYYRMEELRKEYGKKKMEAVMELRKALTAEKTDEGALNSLVETCNRLDREQMEKTKEAKEKNMNMLNLKQKAKMVIMESMMQRVMNPNMRRQGNPEPRGENKERKEDRKPEVK